MERGLLARWVLMVMMVRVVMLGVLSVVELGVW